MSAEASGEGGSFWATLGEVFFQFRREVIAQRNRRPSTGLLVLGEEITKEAQLVCMGVKLTPTGELGRERNVRLYAPNISVYDHESDAEIAHRFMVAQGFIIDRNGAGQADWANHD